MSAKYQRGQIEDAACEFFEITPRAARFGLKPLIDCLPSGEVGSGVVRKYGVSDAVFLITAMTIHRMGIPRQQAMRMARKFHGGGVIAVRGRSYVSLELNGILLMHSEVVRILDKTKPRPRGRTSGGER